jgi:hypothetical protein
MNRPSASLAAGKDVTEGSMLALSMDFFPQLQRLEPLPEVAVSSPPCHKINPKPSWLSSSRVNANAMRGPLRRHTGAN